MLRFVGPEKSWSKSARVNGDPMHARFQSDMSADLEKICDRFTDFPASGPILQPKRTYPFAKWWTLKVNLLGKKRSIDEKEINLLISQWSEYPCLFDKTNPDHKDQNKRNIAGQQIAESLNEALDYEKGADKFITGNFEF